MASIECPNSATLTSKNTFVLFSSYVVQVCRVIIYRWKRFLFLSLVQIIWITFEDVVTPHFFCCALVLFPLQPLTELFLHNWYPWIRSSKLFLVDCSTEKPKFVMVWSFCLYQYMQIKNCLFAIQSSHILIENQLTSNFWIEDGGFYAMSSARFLFELLRKVFALSCSKNSYQFWVVRHNPKN